MADLEKEINFNMWNNIHMTICWNKITDNIPQQKFNSNATNFILKKKFLKTKTTREKVTFSYL